MEDIVSIIIPAYNVEKYIGQCLDSVIRQTYTKLEIIIIDDGSSDSTGVVCDKYALSDKRVSVIHQNNMGLSVARNTGIECSTGKWICFLDSDDWIEDRFVERLLDTAYTYDAEIVACKSRRVDEKGIPIDNNIDSLQIAEFTGEKIIESLYGIGYNIRFEVWNKIWSREVIGSIRFIEGQVSEDIHFDRLVFLNTPQIVYIDITLHNYRVQRPGNTKSSFKIARMCVFNEYSQWINDLKSGGYSQKPILQIGHMASNTAASMYYEAKMSKQDPSLLNELYSKFLYFYSYTDRKTNKFRTLQLFRMCPFVYYVCKRIYRLRSSIKVNNLNKK